MILKDEEVRKRDNFSQWTSVLFNKDNGKVGTAGPAPSPNPFNNTCCCGIFLFIPIALALLGNEWILAFSPFCMRMLIFIFKLYLFILYYLLLLAISVAFGAGQGGPAVGLLLLLLTGPFMLAVCMVGSKVSPKRKRIAMILHIWGCLIILALIIIVIFRLASHIQYGSDD